MSSPCGLVPMSPDVVLGDSRTATRGWKTTRKREICTMESWWAPTQLRGAAAPRVLRAATALASYAAMLYSSIETVKKSPWKGANYLRLTCTLLV